MWFLLCECYFTAWSGYPTSQMMRLRLREVDVLKAPAWEAMGTGSRHSTSPYGTVFSGRLLMCTEPLPLPGWVLSTPCVLSHLTLRSPVRKGLGLPPINRKGGPVAGKEQLWELNPNRFLLLPPPPLSEDWKGRGAKGVSRVESVPTMRKSPDKPPGLSSEQRA